MTAHWIKLAHDWAAERRGIVSVEQFEQRGIGRRIAYRLVDRDEFTMIMPGVLASTHHPRSREQLMVAACTADPSVSIAFITAAREWSFRTVLDDTDVHVIVPHGSRIVLPGIVVHQSRRIDHVDVVNRNDGVRLTSPPRTWFDCCDIMGRKVASSNLEFLLDAGKGTMASYADVAARLGSPKRPGSRTAKAVLGSRDDWSGALQSELERLVLEEIRAQGLPDPVTQLTVRIDGFGTIRFDFAWPQALVALEVDHWFWHAGSEASQRDKARDRAAATLGWRTVRLTDLDVATSLPAAIRDLATILRAAA